MWLCLDKDRKDRCGTTLVSLQQLGSNNQREGRRLLLVCGWQHVSIGNTMNLVAHVEWHQKLNTLTIWRPVGNCQANRCQTEAGDIGNFFVSCTTTVLSGSSISQKDLDWAIGYYVHGSGYAASIYCGNKGFVNVAEPHYKVPSRTYFATNIHPFMMTYKRGF